jgi:hypothetical protein
MPTAQLTLPSANTVYNLLTLLKSATLSTNPFPNKSGATMELILQADAGNVAAIVALIPPGATAVTGGIQLGASDSLTFRSGGSTNSIGLSDKFLIADTNSSKINASWSDA